MATTYLQRTNTSGTSTQKGTISVWIKSSEEPSGNNQTTLASWGDANNHGALLWNGSDKIDAFDYQSGYASQLQTNAVLRDASAWYHIVYSWDTTLSTANDRQKIYINGVEQTYSTRTNYSSGATTSWNANSYSMRVGALNSSSYFSGSMSHVHFIDGTAYPASTFGSTDSTTGQWKINTSPSVTYGNNGFFILKDGNTITDQSGESNDFSLGGGTLTKTEDCPSNNFATLNPLDKWVTGTVTLPTVLSNGNNKFHTSSDSQKAIARTTLGMLKGKYYCEVKIPQIERTWLGICNKNIFDSATNNFWTTNLESGFFWYGNGTAIYNSNDDSYNTYGAYANNDIVMMALDMDNYAFYLGKNGTWLNSGDPTSGSSKTGSVTGVTNFGTDPLTAHGEVFFMAGDSSTAGKSYQQWNFGSPTNAISSSNADGNGYGNFEYSVPSGYLSLNSKNLGSDGG